MKWTLFIFILFMGFSFFFFFKQCCNEHWGTPVSFPSGFLSVYAQQWDCWIIMVFSRQEYWSGLPFPSPMDHVLCVAKGQTQLSDWTGLTDSLFPLTYIYFLPNRAKDNIWFIPLVWAPKHSISSWCIYSNNKAWISNFLMLSDTPFLNVCEVFLFVYFHSTKCVLSTDPAIMWIHKMLFGFRFVLVCYTYKGTLNGASPITLELPPAKNTLLCQQRSF